MRTHSLLISIGLSLGALCRKKGRQPLAQHLAAFAVRCCGCGLAVLLASAPAAFASIGFVQGASQVPQTPQSSVSVSFASAQSAGDLNLVIVGWDESNLQVNSVVDSQGNLYIPLIGPTVSSGSGAQVIYYAKNIAAASSNTVTVTFNAAAPYVDLRILEYSGLDQSSPFEAAVAATGSGASADSGALSTASANDLLIASDYIADATTGPGSGFTQRMITSDADIVEEQITPSAGTYDASAPLTGTSWWVMQMVALRAAGASGGDTQAPTAPSGLSVPAVSDMQINLSWNASTDNVGVSGYRIERCAGSSCSTFAEIANPTVTTAFSDTPLSPSTPYTYRVRATDAAGNSGAYSNTASATTQASTNPVYLQSNFSDPQTPVSSVSATYTSAQVAGDLNVVIIGWNDSNSQITSVSDSQGNTYTLAAGPTSLTGNGTQSIYYSANIASSLAHANTVTVNFNASVPYPDLRILEYGGILTTAPLDVSTGAAGVGTNTDSGPLTTANNHDLLVASNYIADATIGPGSGFTQRLFTGDADIVEDQVVSTAGTYEATAQQTGANFWIMQLVAFKAVVTGGGDSQPPTAPSGLTATVSSSSEIDLSWGASTDDVGVTGYLLERCQGASCTTFAQIAAPSTTSYSDTGLDASTSYTYRVRATDAAGNLSDYSGSATAVTSSGGGGGGGGDTQPPTAPTGLSAGAILSTQISLSWTPSTDNVGVTGYLIERCSGASCTSFAQIGTSTTAGFSDTGLTSSTAYSYRVRAMDAAGKLSDYSNTLSTATSGGSGSGGGPGGTNVYTYDPQGRLSTVTTSGGPTIQYTYDAAGHVISIQSH